MNFDPKNYVGLVKSTARRLYRYEAVRASHNFDDLEQELWVVWVKATRKFDPSKGYAFSTYFVRACLNLGMKISEKQGRQVQTAAYDDMDGDNWISGNDDTEEQVSSALDAETILSKVDPRMALIARLLSDDSALAQEDAALRAKAAHARSLGIDRVDAGVTLPALFKLVGVSRARGYRMVGELKEAINGQQD